MKKAKRVYLKHDEFRFLRMIMQKREIYFIAGTTSMFVPSRNEKYIMTTRSDGELLVRDWPDENGDLLTMTPSEAARAELKRSFPGLRRVGWQSEHIRLFDWRWPMMYRGPFRGNAVYIDLTGAYHQLYSRLWLDVAFPNGYGSLSLGSVAESLKDWKAARNSVVGVTAARETIGVRGFKTIRLKTQNPFLAPALWATIQAILNELAYIAENCGACYIATDGYFFPDESGAGRFEEVLYDNGFKYRKTQGQTHIKTWGSYKTKGKETQTYKRVGQGEARPFRAIRVLDSEFPDRVLRWWAKSIPNFAGKKRAIGGIKEWAMV